MKNLLQTTSVSKKTGNIYLKKSDHAGHFFLFYNVQMKVINILYIASVQWKNYFFLFCKYISKAFIKIVLWIICNIDGNWVSIKVYDKVSKKDLLKYLLPYR